MTFMLTGAALAFVLTLVLASVLGFGVKSSGSGYGWGFALAFRAIVEVVLVAVAVGLLIGAAVLGSANAWSMVGGYLGVRAIALVLECIKSK